MHFSPRLIGYAVPPLLCAAALAMGLHSVSHAESALRGSSVQTLLSHLQTPHRPTPHSHLGLRLPQHLGPDTALPPAPLGAPSATPHRPPALVTPLHVRAWPTTGLALVAALLLWAWAHIRHGIRHGMQQTGRSATAPHGQHRGTATLLAELHHMQQGIGQLVHQVRHAPAPAASLTSTDSPSTPPGHGPQIADILGVVDAMAFQASIVALQAEMAAAHTGEPGGELAMAASEARALASRSAEAAQEIGRLLHARGLPGTLHIPLAGATMAGIVAAIPRVMDTLGHLNPHHRDHPGQTPEARTAATAQPVQTEGPMGAPPQAPSPGLLA